MQRRALGTRRENPAVLVNEKLSQEHDSGPTLDPFGTTVGFLTTVRT